jgi:hypothetical protein
MGQIIVSPSHSAILTNNKKHFKTNARKTVYDTIEEVESRWLV